MSRGREVWGVLLVSLLGAAAAFVYTVPLFRHATTAIPYATGVPPERAVVGLVPGDHLQFLYFLSVARDAFDGRVPPFSDPYEFAAPDPSPRRNFFFVPFTALFALAAPFGEALAYNLLAWASFPATALAVYALGRSLGLATAASTVAAVAVTLVPFRVANVAGGHPAGFVLFLLPLVFAGLEAAWRGGRPAAAAASGLAMIVLAVNEPHYFYFLAFLVPLWLAWALARGSMPAGPPSTGPVVWLLALAAFGPATAWVAYRYRWADRPIEIEGFLLLWAFVTALLWLGWRLATRLRARAGDPEALGEALSWLPLLGLALYPAQVTLEVPHLGRGLVASVAIGLLVAKRPLVAAVARIARPDAATRRRIATLWPAALGLFAGAFLLLQFKGEIEASAAAGGRSAGEVRLFSAAPSDFLARSNTVLTRMLYPGIVPAALAVAGLATAEGRVLALAAVALGILALGFGAPEWLPLYAVAFEAVPFFGMIRQPAKLFAVAFLALSLAAGFGVERLRARLGRRTTALAAAALIVVLGVDFSATLPLGLSTLPAENRAYAAVAERAGETNLLELPLWPGDSAYSSIYQYWATRTRVPTVNGYSPTAPRDYVARVVRPLESMNQGELTAAQSRLLDELDVRLVTLHRDAFPPQVSAYPYRYTLASMRKNPNLAPVTDDDGVFLFERRGGEHEPWSAAIGWPLGVFYEAESLRIGAGVPLDDADASGGTIVHGALRAKDDLPFLYGPYRRFPAGRYRAFFRARGKGRVEATAERGTLVLGSASVDSAALDAVPVGFDLTAPATLELRAHADPSLDVDWVLVEKLDPLPGAGRIEAEDLYALSGTHREIEDASGGAVAVIVPSAAPAGTTVLDGPYRRLDAGEGTVLVRSRGEGFRLSVESADGRSTLESAVVRPAGEWLTTEIRFALARPEIVCTRVISLGRPAEIDFIEMRPAS